MPWYEQAIYWLECEMDHNSIQPRRPELVVLWHWLIVVAIALVALLCLGQAPFVGVGLFGWSIWATKTGIAFTQDQDAALLAMAIAR